MEQAPQLIAVDGLRNEPNWFAELGSLWPGQALCLKYDRVISHQRSKFQVTTQRLKWEPLTALGQDVMMLETAPVAAGGYGKVLVLDGVIQVTERDQFSYAEMIAHLPLFAHEEPRDVLLIGGGDGAVLVEILKHKSVRSATICEIDDMVIAVAKKNYPEYAGIWSHPKLKVVIGDGAAYLEAHKKSFDVVIVDSSDPVGPAEALFQHAFFRSCHRALRKGGILCTQGECMWLHVDIIRQVLSTARELGFSRVEYAYTTIPTYPSGTIGFVVCRKDGKAKLSKATRSAKEALGKKGAKTLRYYSPELHAASFVLPNFVKKALNKKK